MMHRVRYMISCLKEFRTTIAGFVTIGVGIYLLVCQQYEAGCGMIAAGGGLVAAQDVKKQSNNSNPPNQQ